MIARGGDLQGGSTITQQYIKILYLNSEQTLTRKFKELFLAYKINKQLSKEQILEGYLNTIYFGHGAYGIQAASKAYFNIDAKELTRPAGRGAGQRGQQPEPTSIPVVDEDNIPRLTRALPLRDQLDGRDRGHHARRRPRSTAAKLPKFPDVPINERYGGPKGFLLKMVERELGRGRVRLLPDQRRRPEDHHHLRQGGPGRGRRGGPEVSPSRPPTPPARRPRTCTPRSPRSTSAAARCSPSTAVPTTSRTPATGPPPRVRPRRRSRRTRWPPGLKDGFSLDSTFHGNTFTPPGDTTTVRNEYSYQYGDAVTLLKATTDSINTAFVDLTTRWTTARTRS